MFLAYFWGPMPIMIWVAIIIELVKGILTGEGWEDFAVLMCLQFANAIVGFVEENAAGNAIDALRNALKPNAYALRNGKWAKLAARELVPGDVILCKLGDVVPADAILFDGHGQLQMDQAALTGESLPVEKYPWEMLLMGSAVKRGEAHAMVADTGLFTFFGKAAALIASVNATGHLQVVLLKVTMALLISSVLLCGAIFARLMTYTDDPTLIVEATTGGINLGRNGERVMAALSVVIVILVASIPIAIEVVCTSTLAVGSHKMAGMKVIVARLSAIEQLASMTILCSDKTGTLTQNKLALNKPTTTAAPDANKILFWSYVASKKDKGSQDAIDFCLGNGLTEAEHAEIEKYKEEHFEPFNPTSKRTEAHVTGPDGAYIEVSKGAPHMILHLAHNCKEIEAAANAAVQDLADRGFRALGVAINRAGRGVPPKWEYLGCLSLFDPPRHDTKATIEAARKFNIEVKMVTGDHTAIAKETCRELGMGTNILNTSALGTVGADPAVVDKVIREAHGFAEVMPEHKFLIVERLMKQGFMTGMTGDGVNDAPALKRADVGIAVEGATDAARAAADLVLTEPGLSVIIDAVFESRKIFQRMRNYIVYRIACTVQLLLFFFFAIMAIDPSTDFMYGSGSRITQQIAANTLNGVYTTDQAASLLAIPCNGNAAGTVVGTEGCHSNAFTLPVIAMVLITILNDGCMITTASDWVTPDEFPQEWHLAEVTIVALVLGIVACISSLILVAYCMHANVFHPGDFMGNVFGASGRNYITWYEVRTIIYLKVSVSDFLTLFSARTKSWFFERRLSTPLAIAATFALTASTLLALFWGDMFINLSGAYMQSMRFSKGAVLATWLYCILWWFVQDAAKVLTYHLMRKYNFTHIRVAVQAEFVQRHDDKKAPSAHNSVGKAVGSALADTLPNNLPPNALGDMIKASVRGTKLRVCVLFNVSHPPLSPTEFVHFLCAGGQGERRTPHCSDGRLCQACAGSAGAQIIERAKGYVFVFRKTKILNLGIWFSLVADIFSPGNINGIAAAAQCRAGLILLSLLGPWRLGAPAWPPLGQMMMLCSGNRSTGTICS